MKQFPLKTIKTERTTNAPHPRNTFQKTFGSGVGDSFFDADSTARKVLFACSGVPTLDGFCGRIKGGGATGRAGLAGGTLGTVGPGVALAFL